VAPPPNDSVAPATARAPLHLAPWGRRAGIVALIGVCLVLSAPDGVQTARPRAHVEASFEGPAARLTLEAASDGPPSVRVEVWAGQEVVSRAEGALPLMLTAPRGTPLTLVVEAAGRARYVEELELADDRTLRIRFPRGGRITGRVVASGGAHIESASIRLTRIEGPGVVWAARSGPDGRFVVDTLVPGTYRVDVVASGYARLTRDAVPLGANVRLTLGRVGLVSGRVVRPDGRPASDATITIAGSGLWPARTATTNDRGSFVLTDIPPGVYEVRAFEGNLVAAPRRGLEVDPGAPSYLTFALADGVGLRGIVRDSVSGQPIDGAQITVSVEALDAAPRAASSNAEGRFVVHGLREGSHRVSVFAEGYVPISALEWEPGPLLELALDPAGVLAGIVLDEDRNPIEGATIEVLGDAAGQPVELTQASGFRSSVFEAQLTPFEALPSGHARLEVTDGPVPPIPLTPMPTGMGEAFAPIAASAAEVRLSASYFSDAEGRFRVTSVPPGHVQLIARRAGRAPAATARLFVTPGSVREDIELILPPSGTIRGTVRDERREGVEGVMVEVRSDREPFPRMAFTDDRGAFELADVFGELTITAMPAARPAARVTASIASGETEQVELLLEGSLHSLDGRTVDPEGYPIGGVQLSLVSLRADAPMRRTLFSNDDGTFSLTMLPAPPWRIEASDPLHAPVTVDVVSSEGETRVVLARGARVSGAVIDDYTNERVHARVRIVRDTLPAEILETVTDGEGGFTFGRVRAGRWRLTIESNDHLPIERDLEVTERARTPRDVELDPIRLEPAGWITGTVVDATGATVGRAEITLAQTEGPTAMTDGQGNFVLRGIGEGVVVLRASHPAAGEGRSQETRIFVGRETPGVLIHLSERFDPERAAALPGRRRGVAMTIGSDLRVREVIDGSQAERVGLRTGDQILEIDGAVPSSGNEAARMLGGSPDVPAILRVQREDLIAIVVVPRETWIPP
jgi:hypothetical protein